MTCKESMRLALNKAFQLGQRYWSWADSDYSSHWKKADAAKAEFDQLVQDTINAALVEQPAQPQQEPVTYWDLSENEMPVRPRLYDPEEHPNHVPLYTTPPARKPLTVVEIMREWNSANNSVVDFARAIEAAHGIKGDA